MALPLGVCFLGLLFNLTGIGAIIGIPIVFFSIKTIIANEKG